MPAAALMSFEKAPESSALRKPANYAEGVLGRTPPLHAPTPASVAGEAVRSRAAHGLELDHTLNSFHEKRYYCTPELCLNVFPVLGIKLADFTSYETASQRRPAAVLFKNYNKYLFL